MKKLPIGIQSFKELIHGDFLYVDKTKDIFNLLETGKYYFLSRPRRFGKSLLLSTIQEVYQGNQELFKGLWIENQWDWSKTNPVLHISFNSLDYKNFGLTAALENELNNLAKQFNVSLNEQGVSQKFRELIAKLSKERKVAILIDEYDKPIVDYLGRDLKEAAINRDILKNFYSIIKSSDPYIEFLLITGVSKFSRVSIFSDLNNLNDLTLHPRYSTITGYTQTELEHYFANRIKVLSNKIPDLLAKVKSWYNGYSWDGQNFVYNPFSVLSFFDAEEFYNFWFATGTPTFLINLLKNQEIYEVENTMVGQLTLENFEIENIDPITLLFQTGYLTIKHKESPQIFFLDYPNAEVKDAMYQHLLSAYRYTSLHESLVTVVKIRNAFQENDLPIVLKIINALFKDIPSHIFIAKAEAYYHSLIHLLFNYLGVYLNSEVHTSSGRIDATVQTKSHIFIFEFKVDKSAEIALQQIHDKKYADKFLPLGKEIVLVGVNFGSKEKGVENWISETMNNLSRTN